ncbi:CerR family C-terminal domain-containing protein [Alloacidobacterium dinghuense]|uniref:CerR family C-terminal domain-containing protein n=1 Tax=Alloacidobacterium dinghuense TaxID=2763107 RepID=A0A7G8BIP2_9BACT|nr:CerR family C-terminal domain-containing protein [Alloacidobacterium dinghuense]QNI32412.1 CerR family C-terminal domain-containing protein [Alloacidobacterium dinghuense]
MRTKSVREGKGASLEDARARLIEAAIELFAKKGYEGTSVRDLATAAGVNVAAVSYHFGSKDELYHESLRACLAACKTMRDLMQVHLDVAQRAKTRKAAEEALRGCIQDFLNVLMSPEARHSHLVMREQSEGKPRFEPVIREFFQPVGVILRDVILLLAPGLSDMRVFMVISGIIGQCLHVYKARVSYRVLAGVDSHSPEYIEMVSKHIAHLTALGLRGLEREKGTS